ncbi:MAG TPA: hypothetical protein VIM30_13625 [Candidatus Limnocylindrales bacterium]
MAELTCVFWDLDTLRRFRDEVIAADRSGTSRLDEIRQRSRDLG